MDKKKIHPLTILKVKTDVEEKRFKTIPDCMQQPPFNWLLISPTKSGKSNFIVNLLYNKNFGMTDIWDQIYYISPTVMIDKTLKNNVKKDDEIIKIYKEQDIVRSQEEEKDENRKDILVILDDMLEYFSNHSKLNSLPALSRHYMISFIVCSQTFSNGPPLRLRKNSSAFIISNITNEKDKDSIINEIGPNFGKDFKKNLDIATEDKFNFLYCDNRGIKLMHNFENVLWEK